MHGCWFISEDPPGTAWVHLKRQVECIHSCSLDLWMPSLGSVPNEVALWITSPVPWYCHTVWFCVMVTRRKSITTAFLEFVAHLVPQNESCQYLHLSASQLSYEFDDSGCVYVCTAHLNSLMFSSCFVNLEDVYSVTVMLLMNSCSLICGKGYIKQGSGYHLNLCHLSLKAGLVGCAKGA